MLCTLNNNMRKHATCKRNSNPSLHSLMIGKEDILCTEYTHTHTQRDTRTRTHARTQNTIYRYQSQTLCLVNIYIPLCIELSQDQGPFLPLIQDKTILCYTCCWSHGFPQVYSGWWFSPWEPWGGLVGWYCWSPHGVANPFSPNFFIGISAPRPMVGCMHPHQYWSSSCRTS